MVSIKEENGVATRSLAQLVEIAVAALSQAPHPADRVARRGLIAVALTAKGDPTGPGFSEEAPGFHFERAASPLSGIAAPSRAMCENTISTALAEALGDALLVYCGALDDPTGGAHQAIHHRDDRDNGDLGQPCALLGDFLFYK